MSIIGDVIKGTDPATANRDDDATMGKRYAGLYSLVVGAVAVTKEHEAYCIGCGTATELLEAFIEGMERGSAKAESEA